MFQTTNGGFINVLLAYLDGIYEFISALGLAHAGFQIT